MNDVFNGLGTPGLIACHTALSQRRVVKSLGTVALPDEWSIVLTLHCSCTVDACPHTLQVLTTLPVCTSCRCMITLM
jgi:hypothetical protein